MARKKVDRLADVAAAAHKAGLTYGQYVAQTEGFIQYKKPKVLESPDEFGRRHCTYCNRPFRISHESQQFCNEKCWDFFQNGARRKKVTCAICGLEFRDTSTNSMYCSYECKRKRVDMRRSESGIVVAKMMDKRQCKHCGQEFQPRRWNHIFCTKQCQYEAKYGNRANRNCLYCGRLYDGGVGECCSNECAELLRLTLGRR